MMKIMDNADMSEILQKISSMMNQTTQDNSSSNQDVSSSSTEASSSPLQDLLSSIPSSGTNDNQENTNFNLDLETMLKIKNILDTMQSAKNTPEANLLASLKPYLNNNRKQKLDQYMQFLNISKIIDVFNQTNGGVK